MFNIFTESSVNNYTLKSNKEGEKEISVLDNATHREGNYPITGFRLGISAYCDMFTISGGRFYVRCLVFSKDDPNFCRTEE